MLRDGRCWSFSWRCSHEGLNVPYHTKEFVFLDLIPSVGLCIYDGKSVNTNFFAMSSTNLLVLLELSE
jgi:hypothetical protein